jgi:serine/threonine protein kinase
MQRSLGRDWKSYHVTKHMIGPESLGVATSQRLREALGPNYHVLGELGRGGFAMVYSVRDCKRNALIAVKVMRPDLMVSIGLERFRREAEFGMNLHHPNILSVLFTGHRSGLAYYAMPRVAGEPLDQHLLACGPLSISESSSILRDVALGLAHAHERGVVHRDVKPSNIMLANTGKALILDFGIAKALSPDGGSLSFSGQIIGSPQYMSPEQASDSKSIDHRADLYSWAVVGFEMLAGHPPFEGSSVRAVMHKQLTAEVPDVRDFRSEVPQQLAWMLFTCMQKAPKDRWASMMEALLAGGIT